MKKVYLTEEIHQIAVDYLKEHVEVIEGERTDEEYILEKAADCSAILIRSAKITRNIMQSIPKLEVVAKHGVGVDNIDLSAAKELGIRVVNAPNSNINAVAEHSLMLILALAKHTVLMDSYTRNNKFFLRNSVPNIELKVKTLGLIGFGKIARKLAQKVTGLEMRVVASDPFADVTLAKKMQVELMSQDELLAASDFVSVHVPLIPSTVKMVNKEFLEKMKKNAYLVNASRGGVLDEAQLCAALENETIAGAGLDVFESEPPQADNRLFAMEQVVVSPHNAALTEEALLAMAMDSATGVVDVLEGRTPKFQVC